MLALALTTTSSAAGGSAAARQDDLAAMVGEARITVAEVDARCGAKCTRLAAAIVERQRTTLDQLVTEALLAAVPQPTATGMPVSAEEVERYLAAHAADFRGPPERDRAAVRFFLERARREELEAQLVDAARVRRVPALHPERLAGEADAPEAVVATVGTRQIRRSEVEQRAALALYRLRGELARERLRQLDEMIDDHLWADAARARDTTPDALRRELASQLPPVTDEDIERYFVTEQRAKDPQAERRPERIRPYLEFRARHAAEQAFLADARRERTPVVRLAAPPPPRFALDAGPGGYRGAAQPRVRILLLTSYRGEASRRSWALVRDLAGESDVAVAVRPLIPQWDPEATAAAAAVRCASAHGRAWEMQDTVASAVPFPEGRALLELAQRLGLDDAAWQRCMSDPATSAAVVADSAAAERLGLVEPPTVLVEGLVLGRAPSSERVRAAIAAERRAVRPTPGGRPALSAPSRSASASP